MLKLQKRDQDIFMLLNAIWLVSSINIKNIISPQTLLKTFNLRLAKLKKEWYIIEVNKKDRAKNDYIVYQLTNNQFLLNRIKNEIWFEWETTIFNSSYSLYNHQLFLGKLLSFFVWKLKDKNNNFELDFKKCFGSRQIQQILLKETKNKNQNFDYLDKIVIPDFMLNLSNKLYCLELENTNSYNQFLSKIQSYNDLIIYNKNEKFLNIFKNKEIVLVVACWSHKKEKYEEILKENFNLWKYIIRTIEEL